MAREESDREDLLREATALAERAEWEVAGFAETVVAGFRRTGAASFFFGPDPVYQFNEAGELRRGFLDGQLIKAERGGLARLQRVRTAGQVQLRRHDLTNGEVADYLTRMEGDLDRLQSLLAAGQFKLIGEHPPRSDVAARVLLWLQQRPRPTSIASRPNA